LILTDIIMANVALGISTSLYANNSTAFLLQNSHFDNINVIVRDTDKGITLYTGSTGAISVDSWGFGRVTNAARETVFVNGMTISTMNRSTSVL
jgi:hypothetical protein